MLTATQLRTLTALKTLVDSPNIRYRDGAIPRDLIHLLWPGEKELTKRGSFNTRVIWLTLRTLKSGGLVTAGDAEDPHHSLWTLTDAGRLLLLEKSA